MNSTALVILVAYTAVSVVAIAFSLAIWRSTHAQPPRRTDDADTRRLAHGEKTWFMIAIAALGVLLLATIPMIPYGQNAEAADQQRVRVEGVQFAWIMQPNRIQAGVPTRFTVVAPDVTHGFAVYDADNVMEFQVQAVPEHDTDIVHTFDEPGRYQVVCLEFCGVGHHRMLGTLVVEPGDTDEATAEESATW
jgi:cytochrome c oxidase subunit II